LAFVLGVVALGLQGGPELDGGDEEGAAFADLEVAVGVDGSGAVAVAEPAAVHLAAELAHLAALVGKGQSLGLAVEGFDLLCDAQLWTSPWWVPSQVPNSRRAWSMCLTVFGRRLSSTWAR
jgi:hypothetical protein